MTIAPDPFVDFSPTSDDEVRSLLEIAARKPAPIEPHREFQY